MVLKPSPLISRDHAMPTQNEQMYVNLHTKMQNKIQMETFFIRSDRLQASPNFPLVAFIGLFLVIQIVIFCDICLYKIYWKWKC